MLYFNKGDIAYDFSSEELKEAVFESLDRIGPRSQVLVIPPDFTRYHSRAGEITNLIWKYYGPKLKAILPALGTHYAMTPEEITRMFGDIPKSLFLVHDWRRDILTLGRVPAEFLEEVSEGRIHYDWPAQVNRLLVEGGFDLILSVGQVVPHEVIGMANYNKNIFVGTGGSEGINKSHFLGAAYGMERIMGRADNPVRAVLNYASGHFGDSMPLVYLHTVISRSDDGRLATRGFYVGDDHECFYLAADLSLKVNFQLLDKPLKKVVVYLDPSEFKSTWLGNKSIYRTRMAIADGGQLIILAPGLHVFGEDEQIDRLIRKYGYRYTSEILRLTNEKEDLASNLGAAAHLIHGTTDGRFNVFYCTGELSEQEIQSVGYNYLPVKNMMKLYNPAKLTEGVNVMPGGEEIFFISNPALGLWSTKDKF
jgi:nickel-dependent lactate racemase